MSMTDTIKELCFGEEKRQELVEFRTKDGRTVMARTEEEAKAKLREQREAAERERQRAAQQEQERQRAAQQERQRAAQQEQERQTGKSESDRVKELTQENKLLRENLKRMKAYMHEIDSNDGYRKFLAAQKAPKKRVKVDWERYDHLKAGKATQKEIARILGMSVNTLRKCEKERKQ